MELNHEKSAVTGGGRCECEFEATSLSCYTQPSSFLEMAELVNEKVADISCCFTTKVLPDDPQRRVFVPLEIDGHLSHAVQLPNYQVDVLC